MILLDIRMAGEDQGNDSVGDFVTEANGSCLQHQVGN